MDYTLEQVNKTIENLYQSSKLNSIDIHHEDLSKSTTFNTVIALVKINRILQINLYDKKDSKIIKIGKVKGSISYLGGNYFLSYIHDKYQYSIRLSNEWETSTIKRNFRYKEDPIGTIKLFAGINIPSGYFLCDGSMLSITIYPELYAVIGDTYNKSPYYRTGGFPYVPPGRFRIPDLRRRFLVGFDRRRDQQETRGIDSDYFNLGKYGGFEKIVLNPEQVGLVDHTHNISSISVNENWNHRHKWFGDDQLNNLITNSSNPAYSGTTGISRVLSANGYDAKSSLSGNSNLYSTSKDGIHEHTAEMKLNSGRDSSASQAHNNLPPCYVLKYIIKVKY